MAEMDFGGVMETVVTSKEFSLEKAREVLKNETIAVIGYGIQGPGQACNLRDNGFNVIVGQREGKTYEKAVAEGWVPGKTLFSIEEAAQRGTILCMLLSDAGQIAVWPKIKQYLTPGKTLYYSHGFAINWSDRTGVIPPKDVDVILVAPKGSGTSLRTMFCEGRGLNCSYAVYQDAENGHSPSEAFNETVEELTQSLGPLFGAKGMDWMYANCSTTAQRGALDWAPRFKNAIKPVMQWLYYSVKTGNEAQISIDANSKADYREGLEKELAAMRNKEMWRAGETVRKLRPENN